MSANAAAALAVCCGNCRRWAHSDFQEGNQNKAPCAWPEIIQPKQGDPPPMKIPWGIQIIKWEMWRDQGRGCSGFLPAAEAKP